MTYESDSCRYLRLRWSPEGSLPGTVVVPIMFHSIVKDDHVSDVKDITVGQFQSFIFVARTFGYETITTAQLLDFLESNAPIPPRSMLIILDDRRQGVVREHFMPIWEQYDWTLTLAYITGPVVTATEWIQLEELVSTGRIDVQSHGYLHNGSSYITDETPLDVIRQELYAPIPLIEQHAGQTPLAFIWPGGNYRPDAIEMARQAGYRLGFTVHSPMPIMYNWIPLVEDSRQMDDPLMVLPRAWSYEAGPKLQQAAEIGAEAYEYALENYPLEAAWYEANCGAELPPLPTQTPSVTPTQVHTLTFTP